MDDILSPLKIFTDDWGNKWAATLGMQYFGSLFGRDFTVNAEYSHVEPWVYTHFTVEVIATAILIGVWVHLWGQTLR